MSWAAPSLATTPIPYPPNVREAIESSFLLDQRPSPEKISAYRRLLRHKRTFIIGHVKEFRREAEDEKKKKARKKAEQTDTVFALDYAADLLDRLERTHDVIEAYQLGAAILTVEFATRNYSYPLGSVQMPTYFYNMAVDWSADGRTKPGDGRHEASNLVDPASGEYYTPEELDAMIEAGIDISELDPPGDGVLWRRIEDPSRLDVVAHYLEGADSIHGGEPVPFPTDGVTVDLKKIRMTQTKPKIDVRWYDAECRARPMKEQKHCDRIYKLKFGGETHSDPVANALMGAVGYNTDVSLHIKNVRVNLGDSSFEIFQRDWENYFDRQSLWTRMDLKKAMLPGEEGHGHDEQGEYLVFRAAGIESKPHAFQRIGAWSNGLIQKSAVATGMREARGLAMFNVWIANTDLKDAENNKIILREDEASGGLKMFMVEQDAGNALGLVLAEKVDAFPWEAVETSWWSRAFGAMRGRIELNYFAVQQTGLYDTATHADHRWMIRQIAALNREQIAAAVALGRFPGGLGELYVEKLINRRNTLVEAFDLGDEFDPIPVDKKLSTADGSVVNGKVKISEFPDETPVDLGHHWGSLSKPMGPALWRTLRRLMASIIGSIDSLSGEVEINDNLKLYPEIIFHLARNVSPNPAPKTELDQYIVEDTLEIGIRFGVGNFAQGRGTLLRRYRLAYGAPSDWQAKLYGNQALNWFLPIEARRGKLPDRYVLIRVTEAGPGFAITSPQPADQVLPGADVGIDWIHSWRTVIDKRPEGVALWLEGGDAARGEARIWLKIYPIRITFWKATLEAGRNKGKLYMLENGDDLQSDDAVDQAVARMLKGDYDEAKQIGAPSARATDVVYSSIWQQTNLFVVKWSSRLRIDRIGLSALGGRDLGGQSQSSFNRTFRWSFLDNGESYACDVSGFLNHPVRDGQTSKSGDDSSGGRPLIVASYLIDDLNTHSDELDRYHGFLQALGGGKHLLAKRFAAQEWEQVATKGGRWGRLLSEGQLVLREEALDALTTIDAEKVWDGLAKRFDVERAEIDEIRSGLRKRGKERWLAVRGLPVELRGAVSGAERVIYWSGRARRAKGDKRLIHLTRAVGRAGCVYGTNKNGIVLETVLDAIDFPKLAKAGHGSARAHITVPVDVENKLPERKDFIGVMGDVHLLDQLDVVAAPFDEIELYDMMDWAWGEPKRSYISPDVLRKTYD